MGVTTRSQWLAKVLIVADDEASLEKITGLAPAVGAELVTARGVAGALATARTRLFDAALVDVCLAGGEAFPLVAQLRALPGHARLPIAFFSSEGDLDRRVAATHAGGSLFLLSPLDATILGDAIRQLTRARGADQPCVMVIDDDADFSGHVAAVLAGEGIAVQTVAKASLVMRALEKRRPDLVVVDALMPQVDGLDLCRMLRATPRFRDLPILVVTSDISGAQRVAAFEAGADDFLSKPIVAQELLARVKLRIERDLLRRERAERDALTGLFLRTTLLDRTDALLAVARNHGGSLHLCLLDVDDLKHVNDVHGHFAGDGVLVAMGALLTGRFRAEDVSGRWGGDEFAMVFGGASAGSAETAVGRLLGEFSAIDFHDHGGARFRASFSAGVASFPADDGNVDALMRVADRRLYRAKAAGRGCVVAAG